MNSARNSLYDNQNLKTIGKGENKFEKDADCDNKLVHLTNRKKDNELDMSVKSSEGSFDLLDELNRQLTNYKMLKTILYDLKTFNEVTKSIYKEVKFDVQSELQLNDLERIFQNFSEKFEGIEIEQTILKKAFNDFDADSSGKLSLKEVKPLVRKCFSEAANQLEIKIDKLRKKAHIKK